MKSDYKFELSKDHYQESHSKNNINWNYEIIKNKWVGGHFNLSNMSEGYHGILKQWWEYFSKKESEDVLLVAEPPQVKMEFNQIYPHWNIHIIDFFPNLIGMDSKQYDFHGDLCNRVNPLQNEKYDLIINQGTLEHLYDPFTAMFNLFSSLKKGGIIVTHTMAPLYEFHRAPKDYFRFMKDWWYDLPLFFPEVELLEFHMSENTHVFSCYQKKR